MTIGSSAWSGTGVWGWQSADTAASNANNTTLKFPIPFRQAIPGAYCNARIILERSGRCKYAAREPGPHMASISFDAA